MLKPWMRLDGQEERRDPFDDARRIYRLALELWVEMRGMRFRVSTTARRSRSRRMTGMHLRLS